MEIRMKALFQTVLNNCTCPAECLNLSRLWLKSETKRGQRAGTWPLTGRLRVELPR